MGKKDFEQGLIVGMQIGGGGDKSETHRKAIIAAIRLIGEEIGDDATWPEIEDKIESFYVSGMIQRLTQAIQFVNINGIGNITTIVEQSSQIPMMSDLTQIISFNNFTDNKGIITSVIETAFMILAEQFTFEASERAQFMEDDRIIFDGSCHTVSTSKNTNMDKITLGTGNDFSMTLIDNTRWVTESVVIS